MKALLAIDEQASDLSTHSFTVSQQSSNKLPVASQQVSLHSSPDVQQPSVKPAQPSIQ